MTKFDFMPGTSTRADFWRFIAARHAIYRKRKLGKPWPWTKDPLLREFKFTNVFRELDKGTLALRDMLRLREDPELIFFNVAWYRVFNHYEHAHDIGWCPTWERLARAMTAKSERWPRPQIFTGAHMTWAPRGKDKLESYVNMLHQVWEAKHRLTQVCFRESSLQETFNWIRRERFPGIGPFITYEIVTDLRWTPLLDCATDKLTWANIGPGCKRGLARLGLEATVDQLVALYDEAWNGYGLDAAQLQQHHAGACLRNEAEVHWPPFELREIEHCLCEFDKYERLRLGQGKSRAKYHPS